MKGSRQPEADGHRHVLRECILELVQGYDPLRAEGASVSSEKRVQYDATSGANNREGNKRRQMIKESKRVCNQHFPHEQTCRVPW